MVFVPFVVFEQIELKVGICKFSRFVLIKLRKFQTFKFELNLLKNYKMVQRPKIRHILAMVMDNKILEAQGLGSFMGLPRPFFLKSTLFTNSGRGKPPKQPRP